MSGFVFLFAFGTGWVAFTEGRRYNRGKVGQTFVRKGGVPEAVFISCSVLSLAFKNIYIATIYFNCAFNTHFVCVCERGRGREREMEREGDGEICGMWHFSGPKCAKWEAVLRQLHRISVFE